ncbi:MAG: exodeoxyribonuclease VII small subunit [Candidatus Omnitrophica bacterium]|nr:exodeoxyribonuclease VII small subunit [Candidatus Omnitrophota bacterium]
MEDDIKFEKALDQLEKIVTDLESGDLALDEALKRYEEGVKLSRACTKKISEAEKKIEFLTRSLNEAGDVSSESEGSKKSDKKKAKKGGGETDSDFLL